MPNHSAEPPSRSQIRHLGSRLRKAESPTVDDLEMLERVREAYRAALDEVLSILLSDGLTPTARLKTTQTIIEKLRRNESMSLLTMQDIAGARIVADVDYYEQNSLVERISGLFTQSNVVDRREKPSYGYRAVHVIVQVQGRPVEIQVRTRFQDLWAQMIERFADQWGRDIRYGGLPLNPEQELGAGLTRQSAFKYLLSLSSSFYAVEMGNPAVKAAEAMLAELEESSNAVAESDAALAEVRSRLAEARSTVDGLKESLRPHQEAVQQFLRALAGASGVGTSADGSDVQ